MLKHRPAPVDDRRASNHSLRHWWGEFVVVGVIGLVTGQILTGLLAVGAERGAEVVTLHATDDGESLYERVGFRRAAGNPVMRLELGR